MNNLAVIGSILMVSVQSILGGFPVVRTSLGDIKGVDLSSRNGRIFKAFKGIPYAKPPVGGLRFKAPRPVKPWNGTLDATKDGSICIQKNYFFANPKIEGQEDCLYLNVYVPYVATEKHLLPVMVSFHWSGFFAGRGTSDYYGPEYLMDKNIILVTFNYRLGVFGFLSTLDDEAPGNYALKDQVAVLKWVQEHIKSFNGDSQRVTIFGASAGGGSVHLHMISPLSTGLFQQAISQSGSALALWAKPLNDIHKQVVSVQALLVGCNNTTNSKDLIRCLRNIDANVLVDSGDAFKYFSIDPVTPYTLVTEKTTRRNRKPFLTKTPLKYLQEGHFYRVPWIIGTVQNEGNSRASALIQQSAVRDALNRNFTDLMIREMLYEVSVGIDEGNKLDLHRKVTDHYMNGQEFIDPENPENLQGYIDLWSDRSIIYPTYQSIMLHSALGHKPIWVYSFEYKGANSYGDLWAATNERIFFDFGVSHCDDLIYLFNSSALFPILETPTDRRMSEILLERWTNFAIQGKPESTLQDDQWTYVNFTGMDNMKNDNLYFLNITGSTTERSIQQRMQRGFLKDRMLFWASQNLYENFNGLQ